MNHKIVMIKEFSFINDAFSNLKVNIILPININRILNLVGN